MNILRIVAPNKLLHPNSRTHWMKKHTAVRQARGWAIVAGRGQALLLNPIVAVVPLSRDKRRRDLDNILASCKATIDGLTDAGWWVDDHMVRQWTVVEQVTAKRLDENQILILAVEAEDAHLLVKAVEALRGAAVVGRLEMCIASLSATDGRLAPHD